MAFGVSYHLDCYDVAGGCLNGLTYVYGFLERLVEAIGMTPISPPIVMLAPPEYPDKAGVSGWAPLIESGISIHCVEPARFITLDVYSCKMFDETTVYDMARLWWKFGRHESHFLLRGERYGLDDSADDLLGAAHDNRR